MPFIQRTIPTLPSRHFFFSFDVALVACSLLTWLGVVDFVGMEVDHGNQLIIDHCIGNFICYCSGDRMLREQLEREN